MTIPDFQSIMLPLLEFMSDGKEHSIQEAVDYLGEEFKLSDQELNELISSGKQTKLYNRVGWARVYLVKSCLLEAPRRSIIKISDRGRNVLAQKPSKIDMHYLERFPEYMEFRESKRNSQPLRQETKVIEEDRTPEEALEDAYQEIRDNLAQELIAQVKNCSPAFFEHLVVELLVAMGYGGSWREAARAVGRSGDEGIDGIIDEDRLGLDAVYIQAKKWENVVGRPEIQRFVGALSGKRVRKGIFITTSTFSSEATSFVSSIDYRIVLIDGQRLAEFMIDYDIGVTEVTSYSLKRIDSDYFSNG